MSRNYMNVEELIEVLEKFPKDYHIILAQYEQGDSYRYLYKNLISKSTYDKEEMEVGIFELSTNLIDEGYTDEYVYEEKCVVLG